MEAGHNWAHGLWCIWALWFLYNAKNIKEQSDSGNREIKVDLTSNQMEISCKKYCFSWGNFISAKYHWQENASYANCIISLWEKSNFTEAREHLKRNSFDTPHPCLSLFILYISTLQKERLTRFVRIFS